jgi:predicted RNA-binding Zn-ribbon protein involved in translation (DUF1610 family)
MGFLLQYTCTKCNFRSPDFDNALIDPLGMSDLYICSCDKCHSLFHRERNKNKEAVNICPHCGNLRIKIHENHLHIQCPNCDNEELNLECIGTFF